MGSVTSPTAKFKPDAVGRGTIADPMDFSLARACTSLHALGPRAIFEFLTEIERRGPDSREFVRERLAVYNRLGVADIETLTNSGGFPPPPLYEVPE